MATNPTPRLPPSSDQNFSSPAWQKFFHDLYRRVVATGAIAWSLVDKAGSNLTDIVTRNHNDLQNRTTAGAHPATAISNTPAGTVAATTVQAAINEIVSDLAASSGSALVGFIHAGTGTVQRTVEGKLQDFVSVFDFMTAAQIADVKTHTGSINVAAYIKAAYEAIYNIKQGGTLILPAGTYNIGTTTLVFDKPNIRVVGEGIPTRGAYDSRGTNIKYTGTGTAIQLGKTFVSTDPEPFIFGLGLENIHLIVATDTTIGIDVLSAAYGDMSYVTVYGNSVSGRTGIRARGLIVFKFYQVDVQGSGGATPGDYANYATGFYLTKSVYTDTGAIATASTAVTFERCYFHYCSNAFVIDTTGTCTMEACDFESAAIGAVINAQSGISFNRCHFENNQTAEVYFGLSSASVANDVSFHKCEFDAYARARYFDGTSDEGPPYVIRIYDCIFNGSNENQYLFITTFLAAIAANSSIKLGNNHFWNASATVKAGVRISNTTNSTEASFVEFVDMDCILYRFTRSGVAADTTYSNINLTGAVAKARIFDKGHLLLVNTYYTETITAGSYHGHTKINGTDVAQLSTTIIPEITAPGTYYSAPLQNKVAQGDFLTVELTTNATFAPTGGVLVWEVLVAYGKDGTEPQ